MDSYRSFVLAHAVCSKVHTGGGATYGGGAVSGFLSGGCEISPEMRSGGRQTPKKLRGVRPDRGAPPETALGRGRRHRQNNIKETIHNLTLVNLKFKYKCEYKREKL